MEFTITTDDLAFYTRDMSYQAEPGTFKVMVGPSSSKGLEAEFELKVNGI